MTSCDSSPVLSAGSEVVLLQRTKLVILRWLNLVLRMLNTNSAVSSYARLRNFPPKLGNPYSTSYTKEERQDRTHEPQWCQPHRYST